MILYLTKDERSRQGKGCKVVYCHIFMSGAEQICFFDSFVCSFYVSTILKLMFKDYRSYYCWFNCLVSNAHLLYNLFIFIIEGSKA
jgi:hypothetical protein